MVKRYDFKDVDTYGYSPQMEMEEHPQGDYVEYVDYQELDYQNTQLLKDLQDAEDRINYLETRYT